MTQKSKRAPVAHATAETPPEPAGAALTPATDDTIWADYRASWQRHLLARNLAPRTVHSYLQSLDGFARWCLQRRIADPLTLDRPVIEAWLGWELGRSTRLGRPMRPGSVAKNHRHLRVFCRWLAATEAVPDPMAGIPAPIVPAQPVPLFQDTQLRALLEACSGRSFAARRDAAIIRVLLDAGMRISELAGLTLADVDLAPSHQLLRLMGKGRRERVVPFGARTAEALDLYLRSRRRHKDSALDALWLAAHPHRGRLGTDGMRLMLGRRAREAGINERVFAHKFRHTAVDAFLAGGGLEGEAMHLFGWRDRTMVDRYGAAGAQRRALASARRLSLGDRI